MTLFAPAPTPPHGPYDDRLTAPIALYSDPLVAQVLLASLHARQVEQAAAWLGRRPCVQLGYGPAARQLQRHPWGPSVDSLIALPPVLTAMASHPHWLEEMGAAFRHHRAAVMDSIQRLRRRALNGGVLRRTPQQQVTDDGRVIWIEPAGLDLIYVSYYLPEFVYGRWPWPAEPPYSFRPPDSVVFAGSPIAFGIPLNTNGVPWRWYRIAWRGHRIDAVGQAATPAAAAGGAATDAEGSRWARPKGASIRACRSAC